MLIYTRVIDYTNLYLRLTTEIDQTDQFEKKVILHWEMKTCINQTYKKDTENLMMAIN